MKKFLLCLICLVVILFVGFSTYYIIRNDETIEYTVADGDNVYLNLGESIESPIVHKHKAAGSEVQINISNNNVVFDAQKGTFQAAKPGTATVTCIPSNTNFAGLTFTVRVGDGSALNPFYVRTEQDIKNIGQGEFSLSANYELVNDITLSGPIQPIGNAQSAFQGSLFGGEAMYTISNTTIASTDKACGFFGNVGSTAKIERIVFKDIKIEGSYEYAGVIAGINSGLIGQCVVENCQITNSNPSGFTGAVAGLSKSYGARAQVSLCSASGTLVGRNIVGGIVGKNEGAIVDNCKASVDANLSATSSLFGGLVGSNTYSQVEYDGKTKYINSILLNDITFLNHIGAMGKYFALVGQTSVLAGSPSSFTYYDNLFSCASQSYSAVGQNTNDYTLSDNVESSVNYFASISVADSQQASTFAKAAGSTWNFDNLWTTANGTLHINYEGCAGTYQSLPENAFVSEKISSVAQVNKAIDLMRQYPNANLEFEVTKDLSINLAGQSIQPIGSESVPFSGRFVASKGKTVTISNFTIDGGDYSGFFGVVSGNETVVSGITIANASISGKTAGGVVGFNNGAHIENCVAQTVTINGSSIQGGVVGLNKGTVLSSTIDFDTAASVQFEAQNVDGELSIGVVVGYNSGVVDTVAATGGKIVFLQEFDSTIQIGGIVGKMDGGEVKNCGNFNITVDGGAFQGQGKVYVGGIVGYADAGTIKNNFVDSFTGMINQAISESYSAGIVGFVGPAASVVNNLFATGSLSAHNAAGVAGIMNGSVDRCAVEEGALISGFNVAGLVVDHNGQLTNSYALAALSGSSLEAGFVTFLRSGGEGKQTTVKYCYNYCSYSGTGSGYCESATSFRSTKGNWNFTNNIVVGWTVGGGLLIDNVTQCVQRGYKIMVEVEPEEKDENGNITKPAVVQEQTVDSCKKVEIQNHNYNKGSFMIVDNNVLAGRTQFQEFSERGFNSNIWYISTEILDSQQETHLTLIGLPKVPQPPQVEE